MRVTLFAGGTRLRIRFLEIPRRRFNGTFLARACTKMVHHLSLVGYRVCTHSGRFAIKRRQATDCVKKRTTGFFVDINRLVIFVYAYSVYEIRGGVSSEIQKFYTILDIIG